MVAESGPVIGYTDLYLHPAPLALLFLQGIGDQINDDCRLVLGKGCCRDVQNDLIRQH